MQIDDASRRVLARGFRVFLKESFLFFFLLISLLFY